ncbi:hypothetical protein, partial [Paraburkholderia caribensis]|uniref:hypothetical protein n=1 Tax=Paraburkholderia caribensis TaxID=75105 RepID=UPI0020909098
APSAKGASRDPQPVQGKARSVCRVANYALFDALFSKRSIRLHAFWPKPVSAFGLFAVTAFISNSHVLTMLPNLAPHPPRRWQKAPGSCE